MAEMNEEQLRMAFFALFAITSNENVVRKWGQNRVRSLEKHACDMGELLEQQGEELATLQSQLQERNETIDQLEGEINLYQTAVSQKNGSTSQEPDEDLHQRRRRERMLDEVTLICVRSGMHQMTEGLTGQRYAGKAFRDAADNICYGINEYDGTQ